jgi:hypothetical protein
MTGATRGEAFGLVLDGALTQVSMTDRFSGWIDLSYLVCGQRESLERIGKYPTMTSPALRGC